jgi:primosomal protein N' (replication factor Y)
MPELEIVDMCREGRGGRILSSRLQHAVRETVEQGEQALIFLNRRGFAVFLLCSACGKVIQCSYCSVSLTYHQKDDVLRCHYCGWERPVPECCPSCDHPALFHHGFGTERIEEELKKLLPNERIVRVDRDTVNRSAKIAEYLNSIRHQRASILIGTQMIAKGHDFPNITLVGIVNADTSLQIPDFRAGETTVQLLMQVTGRAGRGNRPGRAIIQTYNPQHYTIESVLKMDYLNFCTKELESREQLQYPPFTRFMKLLITSSDEQLTKQASWELAGVCRKAAEELHRSGCHVAVLGPSPAPVSKVSQRYRWHIFLKAWTSQALQDFLESVLSRRSDLPSLRHVHIAVDRDPVSAM